MGRMLPIFLLPLICGCAPTPPLAPTPPARIDSFQGRYRFLSNFWPATVEFEGSEYPTVEHAYQSAKTLDLSQRRRIAELPTPAEAKHAGEALPLRSDWLSIKYDVMLRCVRYKFTHHADLARLLLATGDAYLEEGNTWHDTIWGVYQGHGSNWLGKILMQVREELRMAGTSIRRPEESNLADVPRLRIFAGQIQKLPYMLIPDFARFRIS